VFQQSDDTTEMAWCFAAIRWHNKAKSRLATRQGKPSDKQLSLFARGTKKRWKSHFAMNGLIRRYLFAAVLGATSLMPSHATRAQEEESLPEASTETESGVQVYNQNKLDSTGAVGRAALLSRLGLQPSVEMQWGYDDNVGTAGKPQGSWFTNERFTLFYGLHNDRTQLSLLSGVGLTYFFERANSRAYDVNTYLALSLSHKYSQRLTLAANVYAAYQSEPDFSSDVGLNSRTGNYFHTLDSFSVIYNWSLRFSTITSYTLRRVQYEDSSIGTFEDRFEHTFGQELRFNLLRQTALVGEYRFEITDYDRFPRDSTSHFALAGVDHRFTERLNLVTRGGAEFRSYNDDGEPVNPYFEGSLTYTNAHHSSLSWRTRYSVEEPNVRDALSRTTFRTGLELSYNLSARVKSTVAGYYHHDENRGLAIAGIVPAESSEDSFDVAIDFSYAISRRSTFHVGLERSEVNSAESAQNYSRDRYFASLNFSY
jgi:hypothetical protein